MTNKTDNVGRILDLQRRARDKPSNESTPLVPQNHAVQLPIWPEAVRGVPNSVLRSALFGVIRRGARAYQDAVEKASVDGITVRHTGPQLDQADLDVWEQCLHICRTNGLGAQIDFTAHGFLKAIGRGTGKSQHEWLKGSLRRLMGSVVELRDGDRVYAGQLLQDWARNESTGHHLIRVNPRLVQMYGSDGWSQIEWKERAKLKGQPLALWLHGFYSTHAAPYAYGIDTIHRLCGSECKRLRNFKAELNSALERLNAATGWVAYIDEGDLVRIVKRPTLSQARHLRLKAKKGTA